MCEWIDGDCDPGPTTCFMEQPLGVYPQLAGRVLTVGEAVQVLDGNQGQGRGGGHVHIITMESFLGIEESSEKRNGNNVTSGPPRSRNLSVGGGVFYRASTHEGNIPS
jgi:hypothetical protein